MLLKGALRGGRVQRDTLGVNGGLREVEEGLKEASGAFRGSRGSLGEPIGHFMIRGCQILYETNINGETYVKCT